MIINITVYFKNLMWCSSLILPGVPVVSKSYYDRVGEETFVKKPSGTGPYKVVELSTGEYVDLRAFRRVLGQETPCKKGTDLFCWGGFNKDWPNSRRGKSILIQGVPFTDVKELEKSTNFKVVKLATIHPTRSILFGTNNPKVPWYDKRVRLAMAHGN